jgi:hypothetical protein
MKHSLLRFLAVIMVSTCITHVARSQALPIVTRAYTNDRAGANTNETVLTPNLLLNQGLVRKTTIPVFGDARGMESQALVLPAIKVADGSTHDVMVLPSMANIVRGVDAHTGAALWSTTLGPGAPINGNSAIDLHSINDKWGVLSTGVADPDTGLVYMVAWVSPDGTPEKGVHWIYVLDVANGTVVKPRVSLANLKNGTQAYNAAMRKQRSSLVMTNVNGRKTIFFAYGAVHEDTPAAAGGIIAYDVATNSITAFLPMTQGLGAGIWMGGQGLAADDAGFLYGVTGNGSFNGVNDFGETIFKVRYTPPAASAAGSLAVVTYWSPYSDAGRTGGDPTQSGPAPPMKSKLSGVSAPSEDLARPVNAGMSVSGVKTKVVHSFDSKTGVTVPLLAPENPNDAGWGDEDLGSAGCTLIKSYGFLLCAGKDGIGYVVYAANMGNTLPGDFANASANCKKLASPPVWLTASPGPVDPCPQDSTTLDFMPWGKTRHMHMTPVQYLSPTRGMTIFVWGENSQLHAWTLSSKGTLTYLAQGNEVASIDSLNTPGGMPGGFCSLSSNNNTLGSAILWCSIPYGDANSQITNGRLLAYDPENLTTNADGSQTLKVLWDSERWGLTYVFNKFQTPIVWQGQVYLPNYQGGEDVYGPQN